MQGSADRILATLDAFGFEWDGAVARQSRRLERYEAALDALRMRALLFECSCSRRQVNDEVPYPGTCRNRVPTAQRPARREPTALRVCVESRGIVVPDRVQGFVEQDPAASAGDFIVRRRDGIIAYVLAVIVDDDAQGVTDVVRGADLLAATPQQIYLQQLLGLATPGYAHLPVLVEADGRKLAKSERSVRLDPETAARQLHRVFGLLGLEPPEALGRETVAEAWRWAAANWAMSRVPRRAATPVPP